MSGGTRAQVRFIAILLSASMIICSFAGPWSPLGRDGFVDRAVAQVAFTFVPEIPTIGFGTAPAPGTFEDLAGLGLDDVAFVQGGDEYFGYGPLAADPDSYLVWISDTKGTRYFVVHGMSRFLRGTGVGDGFIELIQEREELFIEFEALMAERDNQLAKGDAGFGFGGAAGLVLWGICVFATGGACGIAVGVLGGFGLVSVSSGVGQYSDYEETSDKLDDLFIRIDRNMKQLQGLEGLADELGGAPGE